MIRIIGTRILVPKGDTGFFTLPVRGARTPGDVAVFSVFDNLTRSTVIEKIVDASNSYLIIEFEHKDTANLPANKYFWDLKIYRKPEYDEDGILIDAMEVDSYYSAFKQPLLIIKEVAKSNV